MNVDPSLYTNMTVSVSTLWHYATGVFSSLCLLGGSLSNGLVIFLFIRNSKLRRPRNFLLINLAVADLGLLLTSNTLHIIASFNKRWPFGQRGCNFYALCGGICGLTSIATMAAISLTRLVAVIDPFSSLKLTGHFILKCIACSWIYGTIWMIAPLFGWNRFVFEGLGTTCTFDYVSKDIWNRLFILMLITGGFLIPLIIIVASYTFILIKLSKRGRHIKSRNGDTRSPRLQSKQAARCYFHSTNPLNDDVSRSVTTPIFETNKFHPISQHIRRTEVRATHTALLVCTIYCIAWAPYAIMAILSQIGFDHFINAYTTTMLGLLTKLAACVNPLIYALSSSTTFRQQICYRTNFLYRCQDRSYSLSSSKYDLNRKAVILKINVRPTPSDLSLQ